MTNLKTFAGIDLAADTPPGVCPDCAAHGMVHVPSGIIYCYCIHTCNGVVRQPGEGWMTFKDLSSQKFKQDILATITAYEIAAGEQVLAEAIDSDATFQ